MEEGPEQLSQGEELNIFYTQEQPSLGSDNAIRTQSLEPPYTYPGTFPVRFQEPLPNSFNRQIIPGFMNQLGPADQEIRLVPYIER